MLGLFLVYWYIWDLKLCVFCLCKYNEIGIRYILIFDFIYLEVMCIEVVYIF